MKKWLMLTGVMIVLNFPGPVVLARDRCVDCHGTQNPTMVKDWNNSAMAASGMACVDCHGEGHTGSDDIDKAVRPAIHACKKCHEQQAEGFAMGKHGRAEEALAMAPMGKKVKAQAPEVFERSCAACHNGICRDGGQCDACHTGHRFSAKEARKPEACLPCHMGNHPQYEAYSNSKHGALYKSRGLDDTVPTCTTCHMPGGNHAVKTSWGFMGMRGQEPDAKNRADQKVVMEALEMLGPVLAPDSFRPDMAQWETKRTEMVEICAGCHTATFAKEQLKAGDRIVDQANHTAAGFINLAKKMKQSNQCSQEEYFWLIRDKMHAQRMSMYVDAFHQFPEGILLELIHFKRETLDLKKKISAGGKTRRKTMSKHQLALGLLLCAAALAPATPADAAMAVETEKITVTATKSERSVDGVAASVAVINRMEIEALGALDLKEVLEKTPGLTFQYGTFPAASSASKASISIRGLGATGTLFLLDGRRLSGEVNNPYDLDRIPASTIERIEIIKGPMSVLYGADALGGVINIITRKPTKKLEGTVGIVTGANSHGDGNKTSGNVSLRGKKKRLSYSFYGNAISTEPYTEGETTTTRIKTPKGHVPPSKHPNPALGNIADSYDVDVSYREESSVYTVGGRIAYDLFEKTRLGIDFNYVEEERDGDYRSSFFPTGVSPAPGKRIPAFDTPVHSHDDNWRRDLSMDLSSTISRDLHLNLKVYNSYYEKRNTTTASNWEDAGFASEDASASLGMNADVDFWSYDGYLVWSLGQDHLVTLGGEYRDEEREGTVFNPKGIPETRNVDHKAFYLQDEWRLTDSLNLTWGGRYDAISNADNKMTFKVGMVQTFSKLFSLRGNFAQGYRTPNIRELYIRKNTPTGLNRGALVTDAELGKLPCALEPEFVNAYELALEGRRDGFHYSVILFYNDISDKIQQVTRNLGTPMAYNTFENISDAETMGMEMAVGYDFKSGVGMDLNWSELDTEDKSTGKDLTFNPEREISATLSYTKDRFNIWTMGRYVGRQYTPEAHDNWVDDHVLVDVGLSYRLGQSENLEVYGGVNNLFDQGVDPLIGSSVGPYLSLGARVNF